ncbi:glycosyltransferase family 2 protein [Roseivivax sediminis]|uniref:Glycosyl transferase family 2 n=1 Tax=Roseivivax sediminis TaxID=936889 RepID=A0A1I1VMM7_9RHOB|nr:glycosyltransferase family 2 protein [Roseivivax sediminis]SFD82313.1 Glycosyl transferase family 2 [Roseivivax sediminis]
MNRWGAVCTTNAALEAVLDFAAWHLELGAQRIYLYLDEPDPETEATLSAHPRLRVVRTDDAYWKKRGGRPEAHQARQSRNARHAYSRRTEVDWLTHIDVDEFLVPERPVEEVLSALPGDVFCTRVRPMEALAPGAGDMPGTRSFKALHLDQTRRAAAARACFPDWADHLSGGFLSHVAGKLFFRTGAEGVQIRIHNVFRAGEQNPGMVELPQIALAHLHAESWDHFLAAYRFRLARGSYRAELKPQVRGPDALSLHDLFRRIEAEGGEAALRRFFEDVATATPTLCAALEREGLLRRLPFAPTALRRTHFPGIVDAEV